MNVKTPNMRERLGLLVLIVTLLAWSFFSKEEHDAIKMQLAGSPVSIGILTAIIITTLTVFLSWNLNNIKSGLVWGSAIGAGLIVIGKFGNQFVFRDYEIIGIAFLLAGGFGIYNLSTYVIKYFVPSKNTD